MAEGGSGERRRLMRILALPAVALVAAVIAIPLAADQWGSSEEPEIVAIPTPTATPVPSATPVPTPSVTPTPAPTPTPLPTPERVVTPPTTLVP